MKSRWSTRTKPVCATIITSASFICHRKRPRMSSRVDLTRCWPNDCTDRTTSPQPSNYNTLPLAKPSTRILSRNRGRNLTLIWPSRSSFRPRVAAMSESRRKAPKRILAWNRRLKISSQRRMQQQSQSRRGSVNVSPLFRSCKKQTMSMSQPACAVQRLKALFTTSKSFSSPPTRRSKKNWPR